MTCGAGGADDAVGWKALWARPLMSGTAPSARYWHSATAVSDERLVVFGGTAGGSLLFNDVHALDAGARPTGRPRARVFG